ncbi:RNA-directed DNA polymerase [Piscirickettsia litoralis]|uniref:Reverse transcriptase domain-containing protein n=1 Tax=Piscirickettsia litoralis TaxID=1891921 RepID=A0ABX3A9F9_9GAMM|nr:RNA-directed DNA polymerase [Piscirickettsia litoralis]ODN42764.1 hypothetical protein BGC07_07295 [Piscirickettsia litoralis]
MTFSIALNKINDMLSSKSINNLADCYASEIKPRHVNTNHNILINKDGKYTWRSLCLIHPLLYIDLVREITKETNWSLIQSKFDDFKSNPKITCMSLPQVEIFEPYGIGSRIAFWLEHVEKESIRSSLDFQFILHTDIANCYPSIYTHSIAWALHGKEFAKKHRSCKKLLGNKIDKKIRQLNFDQTNGIPQGSVLMDFIAEIVLGCLDRILSNKLDDSGIGKYKIIRYRDDYRIFSNDREELAKNF